MTGAETTRTWYLLAEGWLPGWCGVLLFLAAGAFVLYQLRCEFRNRQASSLHRYVLPGLRLLIVGLAVWLLCRPIAKTIERTSTQPRLLVIVDAGNEINGLPRRTLDQHCVDA